MAVLFSSTSYLTAGRSLRESFVHYLGGGKVLELREYSVFAWRHYIRQRAPRQQASWCAPAGDLITCS